ncbi:MAG TPA: M23 family metallopeptidase [Cyclobacteriaceae bacterium]|nr:M23 family metallopeptidase [Cyclobacteriaceae bacterium]
MARTLYQYNPKTCRYEAVPPSRKRAVINTVVFLFLSSILASGAFSVYNRHFDSFTEMWLKNRNVILRSEYKRLDQKAELATTKLAELINKDDSNYRIILDTSPLPASIRSAGIGGSERINLADGENLPLIYDEYRRIDKLRRQVEIEVQSYDEITALLDDKIKMWASRPAIQPIDNRQLGQLHLTYGLRMHPIFKTLMDHKGLDFAAPRGTPVYATGDGTVETSHFSGSYGNVIYINHDHGFETRYAHLSRSAVKKGERVKRGQLIGYVGNTGNSVSPHLHYEVLVNGKNVNPINFFQRDMSNDEYEKLIQMGSQKAEPLD